jgi:hypothetical protein
VNIEFVSILNFQSFIYYVADLVNCSSGAVTGGRSEAIYIAIRNFFGRCLNQGGYLDESRLYQAAGEYAVSLGNRIGVNSRCSAVSNFCSNNAPLFCYLGNILLGGVRNVIQLGVLPVRALFQIVNNFRVGSFNFFNAVADCQYINEIFRNPVSGFNVSIESLDQLIRQAASGPGNYRQANYNYCGNTILNNNLRARADVVLVNREGISRGIGNGINFVYFATLCAYVVAAVAVGGVVAGIIYYNIRSGNANAVQEVADNNVSNNVSGISNRRLCVYIGLYVVSCVLLRSAGLI